MAQKIEKTVSMKGIHTYEAPAYGYGYETRYIYTMIDEDGSIFVWKTATVMTFENRRIAKNDVVAIKANIKCQEEYKGTMQTVLTRVKVTGIVSIAKTEEMIAAEKELRKQQQMDSIADGDLVITMPYRQYKEHYSDCEKIIDSYEDRGGRSYITIIVRNGRLKASGVRGHHFHGYEFEFYIGEKRCITTYSAICEENAYNHLLKDFPEAKNIKMIEVFM